MDVYVNNGFYQGSKITLINNPKCRQFVI